MTNLESIYQNNVEFKGFAKAYLSYVGEVLNSLGVENLEAFMSQLEEVQRGGGTIFIAGNGGSASTASHLSMDLAQVFFKLPNSAAPFKTISLADNTAMVTAIGNDFGYEHVFSKQLEVLYKEGDMLVVISASGNSLNLVNAAELVRNKEGQVLGLLGFDGGKLKEICTHSIVVNTPQGEYGPVEDVHVVLNHLFFGWLYNKYRNKNGARQN